MDKLLNDARICTGQICTFTVLYMDQCTSMYRPNIPMYVVHIVLEFHSKMYDGSDVLDIAVQFALLYQHLPLVLRYPQMLYARWCTDSGVYVRSTISVPFGMYSLYRRYIVPVRLYRSVTLYKDARCTMVSCVRCTSQQRWNVLLY